MHQVLYIVQLPSEEGDMHIIYIALGASDMPCDPNLVSSAFYTILYFLSKLQIYLFSQEWKVKPRRGRQRKTWGTFLRH